MTKDFELLNIKAFPIHRLNENQSLKDIDLNWLKHFYNENQEPFIPQPLFYTSLSVLLNDELLSPEEINAGLQYLRKIEQILNIDLDFALSIKGWVTNKGSSDIDPIIEQIFQSIKENSLESEKIIDILFKNIKNFF